MSRRLPALAAAWVLLAGCASRALDNVERMPSPAPSATPAFGASDLHEAMWRMARDVERVNVIMRRTPAPRSREEQTRILDLLADMEEVAVRLSRDDARNLHPILGRNIDLFRKDLALARKAAAMDPPNFFLAGTVAGACAHCHGVGFDRVSLMKAAAPSAALDSTTDRDGRGRPPARGASGVEE